MIPLNMTFGPSVILEKSNNLEMLLALEWIGNNNISYVEDISNNIGTETIGIKLADKKAQQSLYDYINANL